MLFHLHNVAKVAKVVNFTGLAVAAMALVGASISREVVAADRKQEVIDLFKSIETGDPRPLNVINPDKYIQHNLSGADGLEGLKALLKILPKGETTVNSVRVYHDGDYVFVHNELNLFGPKVSFDILRYENGKIVEHWDNIQPVVARVDSNAGVKGMTEGPTYATDIDRTAANKEIVKAYGNALVQGRTAALASYVDNLAYVEHGAREASTQVKYDNIAMILGEGSFVLAAGQGVVDGKPSGLFDLYRLHNGKIVEHWGNVEAIPPRSEWKNQNGKF